MSLSTRPRARRKAKALLASGIVLGIGAVVTLAAWTDTEFATGTFRSGQFNVQGSTESGTAGFTDHASAAGAATLTLDANAVRMAPAVQSFTPLWVRLAPGTTDAGSIDVTSITATDVSGTGSSAMSWGAYAISPTATCDATAMTTGSLLAGGANLTSITDAGAASALAVGTDAATAGTSVQVCFVITGGANIAQGAETQVVWQLSATSN